MEELEAYKKAGKLAGATNSILSLIERLVSYVVAIIKILFWPITFSWKVAMGQPTLWKKFVIFMFLLLGFQLLLFTIALGLNGSINNS